MKGSTNETPLAEAVRDLFFDRATGILVVTASDVPVQLYFADGSVFYCRSDQPDHRLDRVLVRWGLVSEGDVARLLQAAGSDVRGALIREGIFPDPASFDDFMGRVLRERILDVFGRTPADFEWKPQDVRELDQFSFPDTTPNLILEAARRLPDHGRLLAPLAASGRPLAVHERAQVPLQSLKLSPSEGYVHSLVTGTATVADVCAVCPLGQAETLRLLYGLLLLDLLQHPLSGGHRFTLAHLAHRQAEERVREDDERARITAEYERVRSVDPFQLLPGGSALDDDAFRAALRKYQDEWAPERFTAPVAKEMRDHLRLIAGRAGEATLARMEAGHRRRAAEAVEPVEGGDDSFRLKRMEFSKTETQARLEANERLAEEHVRRAEVAFKAKDYHQAIQFLQQAIRLHETAEYQAMLAEALAQNPHWIHRAEHAYRRAMELDQFDARLPLALGRMYQRAGLKPRARELFEHALKVQADLEEAKQGLKELRRS